MSSTKGPDLSTVTQHLSGTDHSWRAEIKPNSPFPPEQDRYHLYIGLFCPFATRVNIVRHLKGLQEILPMSIVRPYPKGDERGWPGWRFPKDSNEYPEATVDKVFGSTYLNEVYFRADPDYKGRYTVPLIWDRHVGTIVNNESTDLVRNLATAFDEVLLQQGKTKQASLHFYPDHLKNEIDEVCAWLQDDLNVGVYKAGFAANQEEYDQNVLPVFASLNKLEKLVKARGGPFALGKDITEVDLRLYPTLIRFDAVYVQHFKVNLGTIRGQYPVLNNYMKGLYWGESMLTYPDGSVEKVTGFGPETTDFKHIKENYTKSHADVNPKAITPRGPYPNVEQGFEPDWSKLSVGGIDMPEVVALEQSR